MVGTSGSTRTHMGRGRSRGRRIAAIVLLAGLAVIARHPTVRALCRGEIDWSGRRVYAPTFAPDPDALRAIDLRRVHAQLLPDWAIEAARARRGHPHDEPGAFAALLHEAGRDANLRALLLELRPIATDRLDEDGGRALYLLWAWGDYLRRFRQPYWLQAEIAERDEARVLQLSTYHVRHVTDVGLGAHAFEVRFVQRLDGTTLREPFLGATRRGDDFATVVVDRVEDFVVEDVWPLLDLDDESLTPMGRNWAPALRREVEASLHPADFAELQATANLQRRLRSVMRDVRARRGCVRRRLLRRVGYDGLDDARLRQLQGIAERERGAGCPSLTPKELESLAIVSTKLRRRPRLRPAFDALVAVAARHVALHEVRHLADHAALGGLDDVLPCRSCREDMPAEARAELSGHLAAIAWSEVPSMAMYQAGLVVAREPTAPHAAAMDLLTTRVGRPCGSGPPTDLVTVARTLEHEMLERSEPIALPLAFPQRLEKRKP